MRKQFLFVLAAALTLVACSDLNDRISSIETRLDALEATVKTNVTAIEKLVQASNSTVTINSVTPTENGYVISFSDGTTATLTNGKDGADGKDGQNGTDGKDGQNGTDGKDGADGQTPEIGVKEIDGVLYWTVNGELLKYNGENVRVTGQNGADGQPGQDGQTGQDGADGKDGLTPQFKVEDGKWFVSFDGEQWDEVGSAVTEVKSVVTVEETDSEFIFNIDGTLVKIAKTNAFSIKLSAESFPISAGKSVTISYTIVGADATTHVVAEEKNYTATVDEAARTVKITAPNPIQNGYVIVKAVRNSDGAYSAQYVVFEDAAYGIFGGTIWSSDDFYAEW